MERSATEIVKKNRPLKNEYNNAVNVSMFIQIYKRPSRKQYAIGWPVSANRDLKRKIKLSSNKFA